MKPLLGKRTLVIQIHPASGDGEDGSLDVMHQVIETLGLMAQTQFEEGKDWRNVSVATDALESTWASLQSLLSQDATAFAALRRRWIVVAEGSNGWADYKTLAHFDPTVRLDSF